MALDGGLPHVDVELQRDEGNTGGFGGQRLTLSAEDAARTPGALDGELILCDGSGRDYSYRAEVGTHAPAWISFVPCGRFDADFRAANGRRVLISPRLVVEPGWADLELAFAR